MSKRQIDAMKLAIAEVLKELSGSEILPTAEQRIEEGKVATAQTMADMEGGGKQKQEEKPPARSISFKDLPPEGKSQLAAQAGIDITPGEAEDAVETGQEQEND